MNINLLIELLGNWNHLKEKSKHLTYVFFLFFFFNKGQPTLYDPTYTSCFNRNYINTGNKTELKQFHDERNKTWFCDLIYTLSNKL